MCSTKKELLGHLGWEGGRVVLETGTVPVFAQSIVAKVSSTLFP